MNNKLTKNTKIISGATVRNINQFKGTIDNDGRDCTVCGVYKAWGEYGIYARSPFGRRCVCKRCMQQKDSGRNRNEANKARRKLLNRIDPLCLKAKTVRNGMLKRSTQVAPTIKEIEIWLKQQTLICVYSGVPLEPNDFSVDHKIPIERGGTNDFSNLCLCTKSMNTAKGIMTDFEFISLLQMISKWEDNGTKLLSRLRMAGRAFTPK